jgi:hypothetical protein
MRVSLKRPGRFQRLTAVLVNADIGQNGFSPQAFDWRYTGDDQPFGIVARRAGR